VRVLSIPDPLSAGRSAAASHFVAGAQLGGAEGTVEVVVTADSRHATVLDAE